MSWTPRVILRERGPCVFLWHRLHLVRRHQGCEYAECSCGTRRITVLEHGAVLEVAWLRSGEFSSGRLFKVPVEGVR